MEPANATYDETARITIRSIFVSRPRLGGPIDFRKSYRGLGAIVELELGRNPFSGSLYVFINKTHTKIKCLFWEQNGFVLYYKSLAEEKFKWPDSKTELFTLTGQEINFLLDGYDISAMRPHKKLHFESLF